MKKILIVSSESVVVKALISDCESRGDEVTHTILGTDGFYKLLTDHYDLVVCSLFIDGMDGVQLIKTLKNSNTMNSLVPIIMLTSDEGVDKMFSAGQGPNHIILKNENSLVGFQKAFAQIFEDELVSQINILYIDDDRFVQKMIKMWFAKMTNLEVDICGSVGEMKNYLDNKYDIIISDNLLGDGEVGDVIFCIQNSPLKDTPIVVYTGSLDRLNIDEVKSMGNVLDVLEKPFEMEHFFKRIEEIKNH